MLMKVLATFRPSICAVKRIETLTWHLCRHGRVRNTFGLAPVFRQPKNNVWQLLNYRQATVQTAHLRGVDISEQSDPGARGEMATCTVHA